MLAMSMLDGLNLAPFWSVHFAPDFASATRCSHFSSAPTASSHQWREGVTTGRYGKWLGKRSGVPLHRRSLTGRSRALDRQGKYEFRTAARLIARGQPAAVALDDCVAY